MNECLTKRCDSCLYLNPGLHEVEPERERLPHEHIWIVTLVESLLELLQLPAGEVGPRSSPFTTGTVFIRVPRICMGRRVCVCVFMSVCVIVCVCVCEREERLSWQNLAYKAQLSVITPFF